jgi:predicted nucleic acid-binding protein
MTLYLVEENVLREMRPGGDARVAAWLKAVPDSALRLSVMTLFEKRRGLERGLKDPKSAAKCQAALDMFDALEKAYEGRIIPIDQTVGAEWARQLGAKDKNQRDVAIAATARVHDLVVVTRNVKDFRGRGVRVLDPFAAVPTIEEV